MANSVRGETTRSCVHKKKREETKKEKQKIPHQTRKLSQRCPLSPNNLPGGGGLHNWNYKPWRFVGYNPRSRILAKLKKFIQVWKGQPHVVWAVFAQNPIMKKSELKILRLWEEKNWDLGWYPVIGGWHFQRFSRPTFQGMFPIWCEGRCWKALATPTKNHN